MILNTSEKSSGLLINFGRMHSSAKKTGAVF
jgi:hypothetical protein